MDSLGWPHSGQAGGVGRSSQAPTPAAPRVVADLRTTLVPWPRLCRGHIAGFVLLTVQPCALQDGLCRWTLSSCAHQHVHLPQKAKPAPGRGAACRPGLQARTAHDWTKHELISSTGGKDAIRRRGKHAMCEAAVSPTQQTVYSKRFYISRKSPL